MRKEEFKQKMHQIVDELAARIDKLEQRADEIADDAKQEYREQLDNLKGIRDNLSSKLEEYESIADSKWEVIRESAGDFFTSVAEAWIENYERVANAFKKERSKTKKSSIGGPCWIYLDLEVPGGFEPP